MQAVALKAPRSLELIELPDAPPPAASVQVEVAYCGICGSDLHEYESAASPRLMGLMQPVMGHEFSGRVVAVGEGVDDVHVGDLVVGNPGAGCGACAYCASGRENICRNPGGGGMGYGVPGAYAERVTMPHRSAVVLPPGADLRLASLTEPFAVARHALAAARYQPRETLVVAGAGPIGMLTVIAARHLGAGRIIVAEPLPGRRDAAREAGASDVVAPDDLPATVGADGAEVSVDTSGVPDGIAACAVVTARGGRIVITGVGEQAYPMSIPQTILNEHTYIGVLGYTRAEFEETAAMIARGDVDLRPVISETVPLSGTPDAFGRLSEKRDGLRKILVAPHE